MSTIEKITAKPRVAKGTTACRRLRTQGIVPANIYGHKQDPVPVELEAETARRVLRSGTHVVDLEVEGQIEKALIKDVQWDTFSKHLLHMDFLRVDPNERVHLEVPIHLRGTAPGVVAGGVLEQPVHAVEIECLAVQIPDFIQVRIGGLNIGQSIHVRDLVEVPEGVVITTPEDTVLVSVSRLTETEEPVAGAGEEPTEPELAGKSKADED